MASAVREQRATVEMETLTDLKRGEDVTLASVASKRPRSVEECWQLVDLTCGGRQGRKPPPPRSGWKTIRLFVSSTFSDFYSEREALIKEVMMRKKIFN